MRQLVKSTTGSIHVVEGDRTMCGHTVTDRWEAYRHEPVRYSDACADCRWSHGLRKYGEIVPACNVCHEVVVGFSGNHEHFRIEADQ